MPKAKEITRDDRDYDTTQLHEAGHGRTLHRDYSAHFWRWSFARRFITAKHNVLEVGCGEDKPLCKILTGGAAAHVNHYTGVDLNKLKPSNSQRLTFHGEFNFVERYKELLKARPEGFDVVVNYEVIEHMKVEHGANLLKAMFAATKPGGVLLLSTPVYDGKRHAKNHIHEYTAPELQASIEKAGYVIERRFGTFMDIKHIGKVEPHIPGMDGKKMLDAIKLVRQGLEQYFDSDAISNIFGPLYPDHARNNLWVCRKAADGKPVKPVVRKATKGAPF
jgi:2-polyprenyl-3-methyl-5-hydroxy-6-metoxy-1,4-benzoquinol methylase